MFHTLNRSDFIFLSFPPYSTNNKTRNVSLFDQPRQFCFPLLGSHLVSKNTRLLTVELTINEPFMALNLPPQIARIEEKTRPKKRDAQGKF